MLPQLALALGVVLMFAGKDPQLVGTWGMGGEAFLTIAADGTGQMAGESFIWSTEKGVLTVTGGGETDKLGYAVKNGKLVVSMDGTPLTLDKMGGGTSGARAAEEPSVAAMKAQKAPAAAKAPSDQLSQLLLKNAWCSFSFNKTSGYSSKSRVKFFPDGTYSTAAQGEGYSSGYGGTMASQHNTGDAGKWKVTGGQLQMSSSETNGQLVTLPLEVTRNSNGSPIIKANGKEYMVCE